MISERTITVPRVTSGLIISRQINEALEKIEDELNELRHEISNHNCCFCNKRKV